MKDMGSEMFNPALASHYLVFHAASARFCYNFLKTKIQKRKAQELDEDCFSGHAFTIKVGLS